MASLNPENFSALYLEFLTEKLRSGLKEKLMATAEAVVDEVVDLALKDLKVSIETFLAEYGRQQIVDVVVRRRTQD